MPFKAYTGLHWQCFGLYQSLHKKSQGFPITTASAFGVVIGAPPCAQAALEEVRGVVLGVTGLGFAFGGLFSIV